jgi:hypothetical protein
MRLLDFLKIEVIQRSLVSPDAKIDAAIAFTLVRDMPYRRASDRSPETVIREWQGTCSGKHYLLQRLFAELDSPSQIMACTTVVPIDRGEVPEHMLPRYEAANSRFVDVHNYLLVSVPGGGQMVVDATWPITAADAGLTTNPAFILGQDQQIAAVPIESWPIPLDRDPQDFKDELLRTHFTPAELLFREEVIQALGRRTEIG